MITSITSLLAFTLYWVLYMILYGITYETESTNTFKILLFILASKSFSDLIVWINQFDHYENNNNNNNNSIGGNDETTSTSDAGIRAEVLMFAIAGIRSTAREELTMDSISIFKRKPFLTEIKEKKMFTFWFFLLLLFDHNGEGLQTIQQTMEQNKRQLKIHLPSENIINQNQMDKNNIDISNNNHNNSNNPILTNSESSITSTEEAANHNDTSTPSPPSSSSSPPILVTAEMYDAEIDDVKNLSQSLSTYAYIINRIESWITRYI
jgi:hypothetical protein